MARNRKAQGFTLVEIMIVVLIIGILLAIAVPNFLNARTQSRLSATLGNLKQIDTAKQQYAMQNGLITGAAVTSANLTPTYINTWPTGPLSTSTYLPNAVGTDPTFNGSSALTLIANCGTGGSGCPF
jgi:prepilin-type N-terminal cleavage/methylation domain-containing protein